MEKLYSWNAYRSGATITINHSCGKIASVIGIAPENGIIVAQTGTGKKFELCNPKPL